LLIWLGGVGALKVVDECSPDLIDTMNGAILSVIKELRDPVVGTILRGLNDTQNQFKSTL
jgi:hypothetical protein